MQQKGQQCASVCRGRRADEWKTRGFRGHSPNSIATLSRFSAEENLAGCLVVEGFAGTVIDRVDSGGQVVV